MRTEVPRKPFAEYAWHWASVTPSEGLINPPVFFGVLRAISKCEGLRKSSDEVFAALKQVESETADPRMRNPDLHLARDPARNLFRNAGQYWQALGVMKPTVGKIELTKLGRDVAERKIPQDEFIVATIRNLCLPNPHNSSPQELTKWEQAHLTLYPLRLLLEIIIELFDAEPTSGYITKDELCRVIIPLAGSNASISDYVESLLGFRMGSLDVSLWPNCIPGDNDHRSAAEFLQFLAFNEILYLEEGSREGDMKCKLLPEQYELVAAILERAPEPGATIQEDISAAVEDNLVSLVQRTKRVVQQLDRKGQQKFRRKVIRAYGSRCVISNETIPNVLVAAHIMHAKWGGSDEESNGIPLRSDLHILWDEGLLDIMPDGKIRRDSRLEVSPTYGSLPDNVAIPLQVRRSLEWRLKYQ